jgi:hypothetical protein
VTKPEPVPVQVPIIEKQVADEKVGVWLSPNATHYACILLNARLQALSIQLR